MCVLKPAVYQKAKPHWLHLFHFPPCVLSNASSKLLHLRIHNYALQRFHSVTGLTIEIKTGLIFALGSNCNQFKYTPQVLKRLQLLPSHHFIATIDIWASIVLATYGVKNMKGGLGWGDFNMINRSQISKKGLFRRRNLFLRVWKSDTKFLGKWEN